MAEPPPPLTPLDESWERALCVVAHPDDLEFGAAAAVARWTGQGKSIAYCMVTSGEAGIDGMDPDECRRVREEEQRRSAEIVGVDAVEFLGQPDGVLEYGVALRAVITAVGPPAPARRSSSPATSATPGAGPTSTRPTTSPPAGPSSTPSATPATAGSSATRSRAEASSPGAASARSGPSARRSPATGWTPPTPSTPGVASLEAHRAYIDGLGWENFDAREFLEGHARQAGQRMGVAFAAPFEVFPMGWGE